MTLALGIYFSVAIGVSDFFGGFAARRVPALTVVIMGLAASAVTTALAIGIVDGVVTRRDLGLGVASGIALGFALVLMYHAMSVSSAAVVSPVVAVVAAVLPVVYDVASGASLTGLVVAGTVVGIGGLAVTTFSPELGDRARIGAVLGLASGVFFGITLTLLGQASADSGLWSALAQRSTGCIVLVMVALASRVAVVVPRTPRGIRKVAVLQGVTGATGMIAFVTGAQRGSLTEIVVASSMFPAVTTILSAVFDGHPLRWWQVFGIGGCVIGLALIGAG